MNLNRRSIATALLAVVLGTTLVACAPNGTTTTAPEPAPTQTTASQTPTPTPNVHVAVEVSLEGDVVAWSDVVAVHGRGDLPVLWLVPEAGSTLTLVGSNAIEGFYIDGMERTRNADGDLVLSPKLSPFDGSVKSSGGEVCVEIGEPYLCFQVKAVQP